MVIPELVQVGLCGSLILLLGAVMFMLKLNAHLSYRIARRKGGLWVSSKT